MVTAVFTMRRRKSYLCSEDTSQAVLHSTHSQINSTPTNQRKEYGMLLLSFTLGAIAVVNTVDTSYLHLSRISAYLEVKIWYLF